MAKFGLLGKDISYSFSQTFFNIKFEKEGLPHTYLNFDVPCIEQFETIIADHKDLQGLNVTIPYKEAVIPHLFRLDKESKKIGAVNTIKFRKDGKLIGYNTDHYGFARALENFLPIHKKTALILGSGGASKAIKYVLDAMGFNYLQVSRTPSENSVTYGELTRELIKEHFLIINCTPLGTSPNVHEAPNIPYNFLTEQHVLFDLIYNPRETEFMKRGTAKGARVSNGLKMLEHQAKKSWSIWNS
ncbi:MAG TPA: shikimate dehydrogenase [Flavobacteriaceae bacterium]|nr:shikimate dehydrogenase [Flavobacteriaceae bacterium]MAM29261.1 shikimate dehydrogenase [Flavobacteriaceae bacterium]MAY52507.1 shikimate dehydrogenase [Flavobacteriaceae bacterium]HBR52703.1 shikimate dehydrogenase [Flavobacteriaceae bacterium]HIB48210.1 shikimate dehydrogenase [Flavobacteriaceae bacterium]|tara:strand:+ start:941 stop:1672 length:732 start_codon:yes stop_codon:yes gene_type:complete